jgi:hypothetical protein
MKERSYETADACIQGQMKILDRLYLYDLIKEEIQIIFKKRNPTVYGVSYTYIYS